MYASLLGQEDGGMFSGLRLRARWQQYSILKPPPKNLTSDRVVVLAYVEVRMKSSASVKIRLTSYLTLGADEIVSMFLGHVSTANLPQKCS